MEGNKKTCCFRGITETARAPVAEGNKETCCFRGITETAREYLAKYGCFDYRLALTVTATVFSRS